jgi:hypothetical protein
MFKAVTKYGGKFKAMFEVLFQNMTTACFTIDKSGLFLEHVTTQNITISIFLPSNNFDEYIFEDSEPMYIGLGSNINKDFFKYIKNKDVVIMSITKPYIFDFQKENSDGDGLQALEVSIENIQNITPIRHQQYNSQPTEIINNYFNQICRSFTSQMVTVTKENGRVTFSFQTGISKKTLTFKQTSLDDNQLIYQSYYTDQFNRISKISSFISSPVKLYIEHGKPLYLECVSDIGTMKLFIMSRDDE